MDDKTSNFDPYVTRKIEDSNRPAGLPETRVEGDSDTGHGSSGLEVRCPNCHVPIKVAVDTTLTDLTCSVCGSHFSLVDQSEATQTAPPLSTLGRFELIERLGVGGFGSVWKARDKELDRSVAIKIPRQSALSGADQEQFFREARAAAQLRHPNIVSVHEVGRDGENVYIVSDFVRGVTLGDWLTGQKLTNREAADLCAKIAEALEHAHEQGVIHRDLKPANIMIDGDGEPHIMDFGLARRDVGEVTVTMDGQILGTPAYMSPEQALGEAHTADCRSDVYSLGVILFELLTGELPFRGNARMLLHQVINNEPPSPRTFNANVPRDLETIALKCLEKRPEKRYTTAQVVMGDLQRYLKGLPISARPCGLVGRISRWYQRNSMAVILTAGGYATIVCIILMCWCVIGLLLISLGIAQTSQRVKLELLVLMVVFYPSMLLTGVLTLKGNVFGLIGGMLFTVGWTIMNLCGMFRINMGILQLECLSPTLSDPFYFFQLSSLLLLLAVIGSILYVAALFAKTRNIYQNRSDRLH